MRDNPSTPALLRGQTMRTHTAFLSLLWLGIAACSSPCNTPSTSRKAPPLRTQTRPHTNTNRTQRPKHTVLPQTPPHRTDRRPWPRWPKTASRIRALLSLYPPPRVARTLHDAPTPDALYDALQAQARRGDLHVGWPRIIRTLEQEMARAPQSALLWGTYHDSRAQLNAFLRLLGARGLRGATDVIVEMFHATGRWRGVPAHRQQGDEDLLTPLYTRPTHTHLARLHARQNQDNYTAWKYHYLDRMLDLTLLASALRRRVHGCDMPQALQQRLPKDEDLSLRMRELHCALATGLAKQQQITRRRTQKPPPTRRTASTASTASTRTASRATRRTLLFWGQAHVGPLGMPRFLDERNHTTSVYVFGGRSAILSMTRQLRKRVRLMQTALVKLPPAGRLRRYALLLADPFLAIPWSHARTTTARKTRANLEIDGDFDTLWICGRKFSQATKVRLPPGNCTLWLTSKDARRPPIAGSIQLPRRGFVRLSVYPEQRRIELHLRP